MAFLDIFWIMQMIIFLQRIFYENILRSKKNFDIFK